MSNNKTAIRYSSRALSLRALERIFQSGEQLETALSGDFAFAKMESRDRAFARLLVSTVCRYRGQIDRVLNGFLKRTPKSSVMNALRLGAAQILVLKTPAHASVGETVDLVKSDRDMAGMSGLVNAVLRRVVKEGPAQFAKSAPRENIPAWIYKQWENDFGRASARQMALQFLKIPPLDISVKNDIDHWTEQLQGEKLFGQTIRLNEAGSIRSLPGYEEGAWWVQDLSSALPVQFLGDIQDKTVLDMCAAPGGKTLQLAAAGANVTAIDISAIRLERVKENLDRTDLSARIICGDATDPDLISEKFDIVLLDAPCSATGTFRRHPDVLHSKDPRQVSQLQKLQKELLTTGLTHLSPNGILVYCTCSLQTSEGEGQMDWLLKNNPDLEVIRPKEEFWQDSVTENGFLRLLPHQIREKGGLDGFFIAILRQKTR